MRPSEITAPATPQPCEAENEPGHPPADRVTFYWRPGCVFCLLLRRDLAYAGIAHREINIWNDPAGAAQVRAVAEGNETVPTVMVGDHALVNPTGDEVRDVVAERAPHLLGP